MSQESILQEVAAERARQDGIWGGPTHDDAHTPADWVSYIVRYAGMAAEWPYDPPSFRAAMVKIAALAVAATEACDRS